MELSTDDLLAYIGLLYVERSELAKENVALKQALASQQAGKSEESTRRGGGGT